MSKDKQYLIEELNRVSKECCGGKAPTMEVLKDNSDVTGYQIYQNFDGSEHLLYEAGFTSEYNSSINEEKYYSEVRRVSEEYCDGKAPTWEEVEKQGDINPETISNKLNKSWVEILDELNFNHKRTKKAGKREFTKEEFIQKVKNTLSDVEKPLYSSKVSEKMESFPSYQRRWNMSWREVLEKCDVCQEDIPTILWTKEEKKAWLDHKVEKFSYKTNGFPRRTEFENKYGKSGWIDCFYSSWREAVPDEILRDKIIEELRRHSSQNKTPSMASFSENSDFHHYYVSELFGSWINGLEEAGLDTEKARKHSKDYSREKIIEILREASEKIIEDDCAVTQRELLQSDFSLQPSTVYQYFESWNEALREAGLRVNVGIEYTRKELIKDIQRVSEEYCDGETPKTVDINEYSYYNSSIIKNEFGTFNNGIKRAGFKPNTRYFEVSRDKLIAEINEEFQHFPDYKLYKRHKCSVDNSILDSYFSNWRDFMEENIIDITWEEYHKNTFLADVERVMNELGEESIWLAEYSEFDETYHSNAKTYRLFDSWKDVLDLLGVEPKENPMDIVSGEEHPAYIHGESHSVNYGDSWTNDLKKEIRERDGWCCRACGKTNEENRKESGYQLNVHHIKPHWKWDSKEHREMNSPNNLISLCNSCHGRVEGKWQNCDPQEFEQRAKEFLGCVESFEERTVFAY
jgi:hypothetical protein